MSTLTINAFPTTAKITATYDSTTISHIGSLSVSVSNGTVVNYTVEADQCTSKSASHTVNADETIEVILNYIGSVSVDTWVPANGKATFPTHTAMLGKGGWREVSSIEERDAIVSARREAGMAVYVTSQSKLYVLNQDLTTWTEFVNGSTITDYIRKTDTFVNYKHLYFEEIVEYIGETDTNYTNGYFYKHYENIEQTAGAEAATVTISNPQRFDEKLRTIENIIQQQVSYYTIKIDTGLEGWLLVDWYPANGQSPATQRVQSELFEQENGLLITGTLDENTEIRATVNQGWRQADVQPNTAVWGSITGTLSNQTDLNTELTNLQSQIDAVSGRGRYLTLWDCSTGLAETNPPESPYEYRNGDYFIVGTVATAGSDESDEPLVNYRPNGSSYTIGVPSTTIETEEVNINDTYIYDGFTWHLQLNSQKTVSFSGIDGSPYDNSALSAALNDKVTITENFNKIYGTDATGLQTTYDKDMFLTTIRIWSETESD